MDKVQTLGRMRGADSKRLEKSAAPSRAEALMKDVFGKAGIAIGSSDGCDIQVRHCRFYARVLAGGSMALGESYMDGDWESKDLLGTMSKIMRAKLQEQHRLTLRHVLAAASATVLNLQDRERSKVVGRQHYDLPPELYKGFLGDTMQYTCGYYGRGAETLDQAQNAKLDLIIEKLRIVPGMRVLEIGCGWGELAKRMAAQGATVVGLTISEEQAKTARDHCRQYPGVEIRVEDYRDARDVPYDRIVSVGMCEHVGWKNYPTYMRCASRLLKDDGLFLLHTMIGELSRKTFDPWLGKYIFPGAHLPSFAQIDQASEGIFVEEDRHNFGPDYDKTLCAWLENFRAIRPEYEYRKGFGERFCRMWEYYLALCGGAFRSRQNQLCQFLYSKGGIIGGLKPVR